MKICFNTMIIRDRQILLLRRAAWAPLFPNTWHCPTGKIEEGESPHQAALRETYEEIGLRDTLSLGTVVSVLTKNIQNPNLPYQDVSLFFVMKNFEGEPYNKEPRLHPEMKWFDLADLPTPLIPAIKFGIQQYIQGQPYGDFNEEFPTPPMLSTPCQFKKLSKADIPIIVAAFQELGWNKPTALYEEYLQDQNTGKRFVWLAFKNNAFAGYVTLKKCGDYPPFQKEKIPEIADLNVLPAYRHQGIGTAFLEQAEREAEKISPIVGIGVGLTADYGSAQSLYIRRGYVPNGKGATSHFKSLTYGSKVSVDDELILWARKRLR